MSLFSWLKNDDATSLSSPRDNFNTITITMKAETVSRDCQRKAGTVSRQRVHTHSLLMCA